VKPSINGYAAKAYNQGIYDVVNTVQQKGYAQIPLSNNQSIILVQYNSNANTTSSSK
jgi:predicted transcriptional regulator